MKLRLVFALMLICLLGIPVRIEGDTGVVLRDGSRALECLHAGRIPCPEAGKFAPFQHAISIPLLAMGVSPTSVGHLLAWISFGAFLLLLWCTWSTLKPRSPAAAWLAVVVLMSGPLLWYARRSFGEMLAASLATLTVAAMLRRRPSAVVALLAFASCLTKESAPIFVGLLAAWAAWEERLWMTHPKILVGAFVGVVAGGFSLMGINQLRYGTVYNLDYTTEASWTPSWDVVAHQFVGLWLAPTGGLLLYWPLYGVMLGVSSLALIRQSNRFRWVSLAVAWGILLLLFAGMARWWSPFGWWACGPRLFLPWAPVIMMLLLWTKGPDWRIGNAAKAGWAVAAAVLSLQQIANAMMPNFVAQFFSNTVNCRDPRVVPMRVFTDCLVNFMWSDWGLWLGAWQGLGLGSVLAPALVYSSALGIWAWKARSS